MDISATTRKVEPFEIPELFHQILELVDPKDLDSLPLVSRSWTGAALNAKWRRGLIKLSQLLTKLAPLCAHEQTCKMRELDLIDGTETLDWQTFDRHSQMVTAIHVDIAIGPISTRAIKNYLLNLNEPLCKNLVTLKIDPTGTCRDDESDLWLNTLSLFEATQLECMSNLMDFTSLRQFNLSGRIMDDQLGLLYIFLSMPQLRSLSITNLQPTNPNSGFLMDSVTPCSLLIISLSAQSLERLRITLQDINPIYGIQQSPSMGKQLPALKHLTFRHLGLDEPTSWPFAQWPAVLCPNVEILEVENLRLGDGPWSMDEVDVFVNSYFEEQRHLREVAPLPALTVPR
ncbi:hypothetical protein FRB93_003679 [Tulasnella sp. JGI-2019a]|nr:hypothetical protein FRB93_003679 [Tulasnella sp. JGI-2019a]